MDVMDFILDMYCTAVYHRFNVRIANTRSYDKPNVDYISSNDYKSQTSVELWIFGPISDDGSGSRMKRHFPYFPDRHKK